MEALGHSQISLTLNTYSHVMPTMLRHVADSIDNVLTGQAPPVDIPKAAS